VFEEWLSRPLRRSTLLLTHCSSAGTAGTFGVPAWAFSNGGSSGVVPLTARGFGRLSYEASESIVSGEGSSFDGVPGFALTRLQNLASSVGSKKRVSVAAGASGRGLVRGG